MQSAVLLWQVVHPSVMLRYRELEYFEYYFTVS